jgi:hypothetical protein
MPVTGSEGTPRAYVCKALVNRELDDRKAPGVTHHPVGSRVVFRQHDFPTCYSPEGGGMSGAESPPANQQRGSQGKQQVDNPSVRRNPESESRPCQQRSQGHQKSRHAVYLTIWLTIPGCLPILHPSGRRWGATLLSQQVR